MEKETQRRSSKILFYKLNQRINADKNMKKVIKI